MQMSLATDFDWTKNDIVSIEPIIIAFRENRYRNLILYRHRFGFLDKFPRG
jgi:hypothetical protein